MSDDENFIELANSTTPKPDPLLNDEFGVAQVLPGTTWLDWGGSGDGKTVTNDPNALSIDQLVEMRKRDGQARALMRMFTLPIRKAMAEGEWVEPEGGAEAETEFANQMWSLPPQNGGMTVPASKFIRQMLLAIIEGFSVFEEVRDVPEKGPLKGKITIRKLAYRDSRTIKFRTDEKGGFDGVRQITSNGADPVDVIIPKDKCWYFAANEEENPFYGTSFFESAWFHYDVKKKLYYIAHLAAQFAAVPGRIGTTPANPDPRQLAAFKSALANFAFNTAMTAPDGWAVEPFNNNSGFKFLELIDHHNAMMAKSVLAGFLQQEERTVLIDNGQSDASSDLFIMGLEALMGEIAESLSVHLMPRYIDWNFPNPKGYPVFKPSPLADSSKDAIKELFSAVVGLSMLNCTPEFVRELEKKLSSRLGLDIDYEEVEKSEAEAAEAEAKVQEAASAQEAALQAQQAAQGSVGAPGATPSGPPAIGASRSGEVDSLVRMAQELFVLRPDEPGDL